MFYHIVYRFEVTFYDFHIRCNFINTKSAKGDGADHSAPSAVRRDWAKTLVEYYNQQPGGAQQQIWYQLPDHAYQTFLVNNGFQYHEFHIMAISETRIDIMIRPARQ